MTTQKIKTPQSNSGRSVTPQVRSANFEDLFQAGAAQIDPVISLKERFGSAIREARAHEEKGEILGAVEKYERAAAIARAIHQTNGDTRELKNYRAITHKLSILRSRIATDRPITPAPTPQNQSIPNPKAATLRKKAFEHEKTAKNETDPNKKAEIFNRCGRAYLAAGDLDDSVNLKRFNYEDAQRCFNKAAELATDTEVKADNVALSSEIFQRQAIFEEDDAERLRLVVEGAKSLVHAVLLTNDNGKKILWMRQAKELFEKATAESGQERERQEYDGMARELSQEMANLMQRVYMSG